MVWVELDGSELLLEGLCQPRSGCADITRIHDKPNRNHIKKDQGYANQVEQPSYKNEWSGATNIVVRLFKSCEHIIFINKEIQLIC